MSFCAGVCPTVAGRCHKYGPNRLQVFTTIHKHADQMRYMLPMGLPFSPPPRASGTDQAYVHHYTLAGHSFEGDCRASTAASRHDRRESYSKRLVSKEIGSDFKGRDIR